MNLLRASELKVGLLVMAVAGLIAYMSVQISDNPNLFGRAHKAYFLMPDAGGLIKGSQIKTAGIPVGTITDITLQDGLARVDISLKSDVKLTVSAAVQIRSQGILGDKYVDVYPGSPTDPPLENGAEIKSVKDQGSMDSVIAQVGDVASSLKDVAKNLKEAVSDDGTRKHVLGRIILNIEKLTADLSDITSRNKGKINDIVDQVHGITQTLDDLVNDPSDKGFKKRWSTALDRIDSSLKNIDDITGKINRGEGTIGRLINDENMADDVSSAVEGINDFIGGGSKLATGLDFHADYLGNIGNTMTTVGIILQPGLDRYYYLGVVDDPAGVVQVTDRTVDTGGNDVKTVTTDTYHYMLKFNIYFAKNFYDLTVRGGIIENTGGVGFDYVFYHNKIKATLEAFDFTELDLRAQLQYTFWKGVFVEAGVSDIMDNAHKYSNYLGAGLLLTNDDLKMLLTKMPL